MQNIAFTLIMILLIAAVVAFGAVIVVFALVMLALIWAVGVPLKVTANKTTIGYIKWFTFYPTKASK